MIQTQEALRNEETIRELFRKAFLDKEQPQVLALILVRLGYFAPEAQAINPDLVAVGNWILAECGILHRGPGAMAQIHNIAESLARAANDADLENIRTGLLEEDHDDR
jgi:hypothetical protein